MSLPGICFLYYQNKSRNRGWSRQNELVLTWSVSVWCFPYCGDKHRRLSSCKDVLSWPIRWLSRKYRFCPSTFHYHGFLWSSKVSKILVRTLIEGAWWVWSTFFQDVPSNEGIHGSQWSSVCWRTRMVDPPKTLQENLPRFDHSMQGRSGRACIWNEAPWEFYGILSVGAQGYSFFVMLPPIIILVYTVSLSSNLLFVLALEQAPQLWWRPSIPTSKRRIRAAPCKVSGIGL